MSARKSETLVVERYGLKLRSTRRPSQTQRAWLGRGLDQPGGKLPLFDEDGQSYAAQTIRSCIAQGWAEPWFNNPLKPEWLVCRLTSSGRLVAAPGPE